MCLIEILYTHNETSGASSEKENLSLKTHNVTRNFHQQMNEHVTFEILLHFRSEKDTTFFLCQYIRQNYTQKEGDNI